MTHSIWLAFGFLLIVEGVGPFISPKNWRNTVLQVTKNTDNQLRRIGGGLVVAGLIISYFFVN